MKTLPNIHPGEILKEDFLIPMKISAYRLSKETGLSETRISQIIHRQRGISAETAMVLSIFFGTTARFWLNLQNHFDLEELKIKKPDFSKEITRFKVGDFVEKSSKRTKRKKISE